MWLGFWFWVWIFFFLCGFLSVILNLTLNSLNHFNSIQIWSGKQRYVTCSNIHTLLNFWKRTVPKECYIWFSNSEYIHGFPFFFSNVITVITFSNYTHSVRLSLSPSRSPGYISYSQSHNAIHSIPLCVSMPPVHVCMYGRNLILFRHIKPWINFQVDLWLRFKHTHEHTLTHSLNLNFFYYTIKYSILLLNLYDYSMEGSDICFEVVRRAVAGFIYSEAVAW